MIKHAYFLPVFIQFFSLASCKENYKNESTVKQIFSDQKRTTIKNPSDYSFIMSINKGCTAFILDAEKLIGMTAAHCKPKVGSQLCWIDEKTKSKNCTHAAKVDEILEVGPIEQLDYTIFKFSFADTKTPEGLTSVKLAAIDQLKNAAKNQSPIYMIGYPGDKYQKGQLTRSDCLVRNPKIAPESDYWRLETKTSTSTSPSTSKDTNDFAKLQPQWKKLGLDKNPSFKTMLTSCEFDQPETGPRRPSFVSDCSVYAGNSGGPVLAQASGVVIGMPGTYYPEGGVPTKACYTKRTESGENFWDTFFRPIFKSEMPVIENWDTLDRNGTDMKDFPFTIPMHLIVESSKYLKENTKYVTSEVFKP